MRMVLECRAIALEDWLTVRVTHIPRLALGAFCRIVVHKMRGIGCAGHGRRWGLQGC